MTGHLEDAVRDVVTALRNEPPRPADHRRIAAKHDREWPALHRALDRLLDAWDEEEQER